MTKSLVMWNLKINFCEKIKSVTSQENAIGAIPGAFDSWLILRGIKTLSVRMERHEQNAMRIAEFLENHPAVSHVFYPGLSSNQFHILAKQQMTGFGGMISFKLINGDKIKVNSFVKKLKIISLAESLGGVESLVCYPSAMTHGSIPEKQRNAIGVTKDLIRISIGIEDVEDLIEDLSGGLLN
jgi:cystathionine beta-lyase/cystathionine gamma-synthase